MKRWRGAVLRTAYSRLLAVTIGVALLAPAVALWVLDASWESWITDGMALVCGATGCAFLLAGLMGRTGDWTE